MVGSTAGDEARGTLGSVRRSRRKPEPMAETRRLLWGGAPLALLLLLASLTLAACTAGLSDETDASDTPPTQTAAAQPAVENPLPVGQAVDAIAAPAITAVLGKPVLTRAPETEALIVSLVYQAPRTATEGDGKRLRNDLISRGASVDPDYPDVEIHNDAEEFVVLYDTGDPAFQTLRVTVTPGSADVYVNADKAQ